MSILVGHLASAADRGWDFVSPGHGDLNRSCIRALNRSATRPSQHRLEYSGWTRYGAGRAAFARRTDFEPTRRPRAAFARDSSMERGESGRARRLQVWPRATLKPTAVAIFFDVARPRWRRSASANDAVVMEAADTLGW